MKKTTLWAIAMAAATGACAQQNPTAVKYSKIITAEDAKAKLSILAADDMEGRETGKPGAEKAANYLMNEYKKLGLLPANKGSYFLDVPLEQASFVVKSFSINGTTLTSGKDFFAQGSSPAKTIDVKDIVYVGYGSAEELTTDITGKVILLINEERPAKGGEAPAAQGQGRRRMRMSPARMALMQNLQSKKPALILTVSPFINAANSRMLAGMGGGRLTIKSDKPANAQTAVTFAIGTETANALLKPTGKTYADLKAAVDAGTPQTQVVKAAISTSFATETKDVKAVDIVSYIPGSDPKLKDEVLVFSGHYDHIGLNPTGPDKVNNGADDDGSGSVGILEIAGAFAQAKKDGKGPRRTVLFLGNVGEEKGLLGSAWYTDHPVFPLKNTVADLNIDMIGRVGDEYKGKTDSANYVYVIGSGMLSTDLHNINEAANKTYTNMTMDYKYDDPNDPNSFYTRSDHYNFAKHGVPIIFYFNGVHPDYHMPGDEVSKINFPLLAKRAQLVFFTGWDLANRDTRPVVDAKDAPKPTN